MKLPELLSDLGSLMGLANVALDANGVCGLQFDDDVKVSLESNPNSADEVLIHSSVATIQAEDQEDLYRRMLLANHRREATQGAVFSLDETSGDVVIWTQFDTEHGDVEALAETLAKFVATVRDWSIRLNQAHTAGWTDATAVGADMIRV